MGAAPIFVSVAMATPDTRSPATAPRRAGPSPLASWRRVGAKDSPRREASSQIGCCMRARRRGGRGRRRPRRRPAAPRRRGGRQVAGPAAPWERGPAARARRPAASRRGGGAKKALSTAFRGCVWRNAAFKLQNAAPGEAVWGPGEARRRLAGAPPGRPPPAAPPHPRRAPTPPRTHPAARPPAASAAAVALRQAAAPLPRHAPVGPALPPCRPPPSPAAARPPARNERKQGGGDGHSSWGPPPSRAGTLTA
jgi:hypothetical protein